MTQKTTMIRLMAGLAAIGGAAAMDAAAQTYPVKPVKLVVGFTPGGVADAIARLLAQHMSPLLGQSVVVENRGGASGAIAYDMVAKSPPDGYTLLIVGATAAVLPAIRKSLPYDLVRDLTGVGMVAIAPFVLTVHPSVPAKNVKELVALARSRPGGMSYGSVGAGSPPHLMGELFNLMAGTKIEHIPYKGGGDNAIANASGQIEMSYLSVPSLLPLLSGNRLRPLAVTGAKRSASMPNLPTIDEAGLPGYDYSNWNGVVTSTGTPKDVIAKLNGIMVKVLATTELRDALTKQGLDTQSSTADQLQTFIRGEVEKNAKLIKTIGMKAE